MKLKQFTILIAFSMLLLSCNKNDGVADTSKTTAKPANITDSISYAIGFDIGQNFLKTLTDDSVAVNTDYIYKGIADGLVDKPDSSKALLSKADMAAAMQSMQATMQAKQEAKMKERQEKYEARKKTALEDGKKFLEENKGKAGVTSDPSGIQYRVLTAGNGPQPKKTDNVKFHIIGKFTDGEEFQSTYSMPEPPEAPIAQLMPGMQIALSKMNVGSKWEVIVPPALAYGEQETGVVPPNSVIVFEIELLDIVKNAPAPPAPTR
ncbi:MAG: FKBP-type peptidyl-prolyl cis-trans isomerase [Ignavibacteria bacterium]|jgi:FKBP-type peptidyl-prolyl cis-trans isomerase|nr:FKBP-type peptidyl-prolyl cis-trans isomerase [Ignavibacteria bacterium]